MGKLIAVIAALFALGWCAPAAFGDASVRAFDVPGGDPVFMDFSGVGDPSDHSVSILPGEKVRFFYDENTSGHNVVFEGTQPSSCVLTVGPPINPVPPLPSYSIPGPWDGSCTFNTPGTYSFYCDAHKTQNMRGEVIVGSTTNGAPSVTSSRTPAGNVTPGTPITFSATGTDPDGDTLTYSWTFGDGATSTQQNPTYSYASPGDYTATVTVSDGHGGTNSSAMPVRVTQTNRAPIVTARRTPAGDVTTGTPITFSTDAMDPDGDTLSYAWSFGDGASSAQQNPIHSYAAPGDYVANVTVLDGRGGMQMVPMSVRVTQANRAPTVTVARTPTGPVTPGTVVTFDATGTDADDDALTYTWEFGDGTSGSGASVTHAFATMGGYAVKVTASDGRGGNASTAVPVDVEDPPPPVTTNPSTNNTPTTNPAPAQNPPTATLTGKARQKLGSSVALVLSGASDAVTVNATATTTLKGKSYKLTPLRNLRVAKGVQAKLALKVPAALRKAKSLKVKVTVTLTAANGKSATLTKTVTLTR